MGVSRVGGLTAQSWDARSLVWQELLHDPDVETLTGPQGWQGWDQRFPSPYMPDLFVGEGARNTVLTLVDEGSGEEVSVLGRAGIEVVTEGWYYCDEHCQVGHFGVDRADLDPLGRNDPRVPEPIRVVLDMETLLPLARELPWESWSGELTDFRVVEILRPDQYSLEAVFDEAVLPRDEHTGEGWLSLFIPYLEANGFDFRNRFPWLEWSERLSSGHGAARAVATEDLSVEAVTPPGFESSGVEAAGGWEFQVLRAPFRQVVVFSRPLGDFEDPTGERGGAVWMPNVDMILRGPVQIDEYVPSVGAGAGNTFRIVTGPMVRDHAEGVVGDRVALIYGDMTMADLHSLIDGLEA
ncbi:MAG: hypothetical protein H8E59_06315 [Actinobacteria bacterium]|nr:hypothetical protein [Actinomycetota bacterium]